MVGLITVSLHSFPKQGIKVKMFDGDDYKGIDEVLMKNKSFIL